MSSAADRLTREQIEILFQDALSLFRGIGCSYKTVENLKTWRDMALASLPGPDAQGGECLECGGRGVVRSAFILDQYMACPTCQGTGQRPQRRLDEGVSAFVHVEEGHRADQGWQPIETAPRDGTAILAFDPKWQSPHVICWSRTYKQWKGGANNCSPTHWMPLPQPPKVKL